MSTRYRFTTVKAVAVLFLLLLGACSKDKDEVTPKKATPHEKISDEVKDQFVKLGFDVSDIKLVADIDPAGKESGKKNYLLEGDIVITPENLKAMLGSDIHSKGAVTEQYRTSNLVYTGYPFYTRTIKVLGVTSGFYVLDSKMRTALTDAVNNYKALYGSNFNLKFSLTFGSSFNTGNYDIVVWNVPGSPGGQAGFPSGGNPYKWVNIYSQTSQYSTNVVEHVITHEIGHCLGLRHTDYFNRSLSCGGSAINEGGGDVGAIHVPGTPVGFDSNSVMKACFSSYQTGEFGNYDIVALKNLY